MITNDNESWHDLTVKSLSRLLRGIRLNHDGDFYCLNCFHSYRTVNKLKKHERLCSKNDYCHVKCQKKIKNIRIQPRRKIIESSVYYLCRLRMFAWKNRHMSK